MKHLQRTLPEARFYVLAVDDLHGDKPRGPYTRMRARIAQEAEPSVKVVTAAQLARIRERGRLFLNAKGEIQRRPAYDDLGKGG